MPALMMNQTPSTVVVTPDTMSACGRPKSVGQPLISSSAIQLRS